jgi:uncharacterized membrane protein YfcA
MSKRTAFWLAWFTWVLYLVVAIVSLLFQIKNAPPDLLNETFNALVLLAFALSLWLRPRKPQEKPEQPGKKREERLGDARSYR